MNPADLPSRGCTARQLVESRWWEGPAWLKLPGELWPSTGYSTNESEVDSEIKKSTSQNKNKISSNITIETDISMLVLRQNEDWYMKKQSKYLKIIRITAWILRFTNNCRISRNTRLSGELSTEEFITAERIVLRLSQRESFSTENEPRFSTLDIWKDEHGLLRLKSPIVNREDEYDFRCPIVLDRKHSTVTKLIEYSHQQLNHAGVQIVMSNLRERFWILSCRVAVRSVIVALYAKDTESKTWKLHLVIYLRIG